ncbi:flagellar biosynthesis protein FlhB [Pseudomonas asuensis]|jgi:flagellar biosynthetic protein FlhB|uniref:Flagellar biosynthetic protein FlhB n=1 Tax=Pseudomonas asuensis TaxID=1825787 RepID=A0ABQ2GLZ6_9PSED|nr:flagellar biosynthesis protein FlhB [Pseudomonas asuensis]GGM02994.1 flagellar biosynthesis protein FlhB [Pseudomonas asuensis]
MSDESSSEDRTEEPTDKRKREAREEGQLPRSRELGTLTVVMGGLIALLAFGSVLGDALLDLMRGSFSLNREAVLDERSMGILLLASGKTAMLGMIPIFVVLVLAAVIGPIALGGFLFSSKSLQPKFSRMNPLSGLKRMFSTHALMELSKALIKFVLLLTIAILVLLSERDALLSIAKEPLGSAIVHSIQVAGHAALMVSLGLFIIAGVDVPFQWYSSKKKLMMTKQQIKDEYKDSEGKPEVKGRMRQMQREMAQRRMMTAVPQADVIITNPTHYAVALKYDSATGGAPILVAKGSDFVALKIRELAQEHAVTTLESPALARAVYYSTDIDKEIPAGLYIAVAQVLAYVYQLKQYKAGQGRRPERPYEPPIPPDLRRDE